MVFGQGSLNALEVLLVKEFRTLQDLISLTRDERAALTQGDAATLQPLVEEKETVLDQIGLLEDSRRMLTEKAAIELGLEKPISSIADLLPHLLPEIAERINHLQEGIVTLVEQARDLNMGNRALATTRMDWVNSTKTYLLSFYQSPVSYQPPGMPASKHQIPVWDMDHRA